MYRCTIMSKSNRCYIEKDIDPHSKRLRRANSTDAEARTGNSSDGWLGTPGEFRDPEMKVLYHLPSGKLLHNYGTSPCLMGISTIDGHFQ